MASVYDAFILKVIKFGMKRVELFFFVEIRYRQYSKSHGYAKDLVSKVLMGNKALVRAYGQLLSTPLPLILF